jgi:hypothetical protein
MVGAYADICSEVINNKIDLHTFANKLFGTFFDP